MIVSLRNDVGMVKEVETGFDFMILFFTFFVPLFRRDWKFFIIMFIVDMLTFGVTGIVFGFIYNRFYIRDLLEKGYKPLTESDRQLLIQKKIIRDFVTH